MRRMVLSLTSILLAIFFWAGTASAQNKEIDAYETKLQALEKQTQEIRAEREKGLAESNALAEKIARLKKQWPQEKSLIKEYQLKERLRESHQLAQKMEALNQQLMKLEKDAKSLKEKLDGLYENKIDTLIKKLEKEEDLHRKEQTLREILALRQKKVDLLALQPSEGDTLAALPSITVRADDTPEEIKEKINLMKDYQDKLNHHIGALDAKIKKYVIERKTREKLAEFISESHLATGDSAVGGVARSGTFSGGNVIGDTRAIGSSNTNLQKQARDIPPSGDQNLSKKSPDDEIKKLEKEKKILQERGKVLQEGIRSLNESLKSYERKNDGGFLLRRDFNIMYAASVWAL